MQRDDAEGLTKLYSQFLENGYESKDRNTQFEQRKAFQRLLYVSQVVFGDQKSAFLLPWRRHFNITDAQASISTAQQPAAARRRAGCQSSQWSSQRSSQWSSSG
ncbi:uncharacterized protein HaLaN_00441 [Haematococcus lacustris]|uniref:Uncharacterized protein n=1 Tax=Haematococcus lacustris TaxID=44745 RepID=A0A699YJ04_HAELA|nr:uncharacterized protein HaLaN_00441 [Haematococcus lacustris]